MVNKVLAAYVAADFLFVATGAIMVGFSVIVQNTMFDAPLDGGQAARNLLYQQFPLTAGIVNGVFIFATFAITLPAIAMPTRGWLKFGGYMATICSFFSVILGLYLWIITLRTKESLAPVWSAQSPHVQDLMQTTVRSHPENY